MLADDTIIVENYRSDLRNKLGIINSWLINDNDNKFVVKEVETDPYCHRWWLFYSIRKYPHSKNLYLVGNE